VIAGERSGRVTVITIDNAPLNILSIRGGVVRDLRAAIAVSAADAGCHAIVLRGAGRCFSAGADIADFDGPSASAGDLRQLFEQVGAAGKPVVSILHGFVLGAGLELALAGDYRLTVAGTRLGFPEIKLGLLPGGGGTQRLPRVVGTAAALDLMISGAPIDEVKALGLNPRPGCPPRVATPQRSSPTPARSPDIEQSFGGARSETAPPTGFSTVSKPRKRSTCAPDSRSKPRCSTNSCGRTRPADYGTRSSPNDRLRAFRGRRTFDHHRPSGRQRSSAQARWAPVLRSP